jgi:hypothetical protein
MELLDQIRVRRFRGEPADASIQLLRGSLAAIPAEHAVDLLVVSAFPESYTPNAGTLFASLYERGLDMRQVAEHKSEDERKRLGCWLSRPMPPDVVARFNFQRILCFEPSHPAFGESSQGEEIAANVGFVFRCLNNFVIPDLKNERNFNINKVAMPVLATGNQRVALDVMFPQLLEAAIFWLQEGLPIQELKIVVFRPEHLPKAQGIFSRVNSTYRPAHEGHRESAGGEAPDSSWETQLAERLRNEVVDTCKRRLRERLMAEATVNEKSLLERLFERIADTHSGTSEGTSRAGASSPNEYDVFVSYAHEHDQEVKEFVEAMRQKAPNVKIFYDRTSIPPGGQWIKMISDAVQKTRSFIAILSPQYTASPVCWDEFQCAKLKEYNTRQSIIRTIRLFREKDLPPMMGIYSYVDCAEGDLAKLRQAAANVVQ